MIWGLAIAVAVVAAVSLVHPPTSIAFPIVSILHCVIAVAIAHKPRQPGPIRVTRLGPVSAFVGFLCGASGFAAWLVASVVWIDELPTSKLLGLALLSLTVCATPALLLRQGDSPFAEGDEPS